MPRHLDRLAWRLLVLSFLFAQTVAAEDVGWDGEGATNQWDSTVLDDGTLRSNWLPDTFFPIAGDSIVLADTSLAGEVTIDLGGVVRSIDRVETNGVDGVYTFANGTLALHYVGSANALLANNGGGALMIDSDVQLSPASANATQRFNVNTTGDTITINGDVSTSQASGITTLMLTSRNVTLAPSINVIGVISDGGGRVQLVAGLNSDLANHTGVVRVTGDNTFTGSVGVNAAILEFDSIENVGGPANALGQAPLADSAILIGNAGEAGAHRGTLRYLGSGHTSDRVIRLNGGANDTAAIESSGSGPLVLTGGVTTNGEGQLFRLGGTNLDGNELSGAIEAPAGAGVTSIAKEGPGKWILSGNSPGLDNAFVVEEGELVVTGTIGGAGPNVFSINTQPGGTLTLDGGAITARGIDNDGALNFRSGTITLAGTNSTVGGSFTVGTQGAGVLRLNSGNHTFGDVTLQGVGDRIEINSGLNQFTNLDNSAGGIILAAAVTPDVQINGGTFTDRIDAGTRQFNPLIRGTGGYTKLGAGTIEFNQTAQHVYAGETRIEEGTLRLLGTSGLPDSSPVYIAAGATLDVASNVSGDSIGPLTGEGTIQTAESMGIGINTAGQTATFAGSVIGGGNLAKRGAGTLVLTDANTHTGPTTLETAGGTLQIAPGGSIIGTSGVTYSAGTIAVAGGTLDTPGNLTPVSNDAVLSITAGMLKANAIDRSGNPLGPVNWTGGTVHLLTPTAIDGRGAEISRPFGASLTVDDDMQLIVDAELTANGALALTGGSVTADNVVVAGSSINFSAGLLHLRQGQTLGAARLTQLDVAAPLGASRTLRIDGAATIDAPLTLAGGTLAAGSLVNPGNLILGGGLLEVTAGDLTIADGETVDVTSGMTINVTAGGLDNNGELNAINAELTFSTGVTNSGEINLINSTLNGDLVNGAAGSATLLGSNTLGDDLLLSGSSSMILAIDGADDFDMVTVGGAATVDGALSVSLGGGFTPLAGQQFEVLTAASVLDNGLTLAGPAAAMFDLVVGGDRVVLRAVGGVAGDYNGDGVVDAGDFTVWRDTLGSTTNLLADGDGDGAVGAGDYQVWAESYGAAASGEATDGSAAAPEPSTVALAMTSLALVARGRRRRV